MSASRHSRTGQSKLWATCRALVVVALAASSVAIFSPTPAGAASLGYRIDLNVLVLDDGSAWVDAIKSQMQIEGVPFNAVDTSAATPVINNSFLTASATEARYQAVVAPDHALSELTGSEITALKAYEAKFGIRQVDAFENNINTFSEVGLGVSTFDNDLNGATAQVTAAGTAAGFGYLKGPVPFSIGSYTHIATPLTGGALPVGATYTTLVESAPPLGGTTGSIVGVYSNAGVEQMVITAAFASTFLQFKYLGHGIISWMTRGVHFGYNRNNFTMHFDDAFSTDALWDSGLNCTPGEDCLIGTDPPGARMSADDVTYAVSWMQANHYDLTLAFNSASADNTSIPPDPLTAAFVTNEAAFRWLNHGLEHIYQGCQQDFSVIPWVCKSSGGQTLWTSQSDIYNEIHDNILRGQQLGLSFDPTEYLSGEHSGLQFTSAVPGQTQVDNPNFILALAQAGITDIGADASREPAGRVIGTPPTTATTIPRHPTALYYNTSTMAQAIDEYNWFYAAAPEGSGACGTTVPPCITPLTAPSQFVSYIVPTDAAFDLGFILSNDPRPFYAHTTNLTGDRLAYYLLDSILGTYRTVFTDATPVTNLTLTQAANQLSQQQQWATDMSSVAGYVQNGVISITKSAQPGTAVTVPFTAPTGTTFTNGNTPEPYGGEVSGWLTPATSFTGSLLPAPTLVTTGGTFPLGQSSTMTFAVASTPTATVSVSTAPANLPNQPTLPSGLTYTPTPGGGSITGTPAAGTSGNYTLAVNVVTAGYNHLESVTLTVPSVPQITSANSATAVAGSPFTFNVTSSGSPAATISQSGTLPTGITFSAAANTGMATLSGTTSAAPGAYPFTLTATGVGGVTTQPFTLTVLTTPQFTSAASATAVVGAPFSYTVTTTGTPAATITQSGAFPAGLTFAAGANGTATVSGAASKSAAGQSFPITFTATSSVGHATQSFVLTVHTDYVSLISLTPARLADTRAIESTVDGLFAGIGAQPGGSTLQLMVAGRGGVPADAAAVSLNVTATDPQASGFVTVYPCGEAQPLASNLNYTPGAVIPNAVIAKVGVDGKVCLFVMSETHLVVDVNGYFPSTSSFNSMNPVRVLDTRAGFTTIDGLSQAEGLRPAGSATTLQITGRARVPVDAPAVVLNVTVTEAQGAGFVTVYPCGTALPTASNLNFVSGSTVANLVVAKIAADGTVCIYNSAATHLVVDMDGYFPAATSYRPVDPARLLETRAGLHTIDGQSEGGGVLPPGTVTELTVSGRGGLPANVATVVLNVTVTETTAGGYVTAYPCGIDPPLASNLNYGIGTTVAIAAIVQVSGNGKVCLFNYGGTQLVVDVNGYLLS